MPAISGLMTVLQTSDPLTRNDIHWLMIFGGVIAAAMVFQAFGLMISAFLAYKMGKKVEALSNNVEQKLSPILSKTTVVLTDLAPRIQAISSNVEQVSYTVRAKVDELGATVSQLNETVNEINARTRRQVVHVDGIVTEALYATEEISRTVQDQIRKPVKQMVGIIAGLQAGFATLVEKSPFGKRNRPGPYDL